MGTPLRLFKSIFVDELADMIIGYTKLHGHREKAGTSFENLYRLFFCLVGAISFQTVEYIGRRSLILL